MLECDVFIIEYVLEDGHLDHTDVGCGPEPGVAVDDGEAAVLPDVDGLRVVEAMRLHVFLDGREVVALDVEQRLEGFADNQFLDPGSSKHRSPPFRRRDCLDADGDAS
jgi:hypothetical protein